MLTEKLNRYGGFGTHDALKLIGLLLMLVDHTGFFGFPHDIWPRIFGRAAAPIFFFLIGYSRSYCFHVDLLVAAVLLIAVKLIGAQSYTYFNILVGFLIVRLLLDQIEKGRLPLKYPWLAFLALAILWPFSWYWFEYGTIGFMFSLCGYLQKHADRYKPTSRLLMLIASFAIYELMTCLTTIPNPGIAGFLLLTAVLTVCAMLLWRYTTHRLVFPEKWQGLESVLAWPARYSLWIYTLHLVILTLITGIYI